MSSTKIEAPAIPATAAPPRPPRARGSIAARLAWLNLAASALLLLAAEAFLYWGLDRSLRAESERLLATKLDIVRFLLGNPAKADALADEIEHEAGSGHAAKYYIRVLDPGGRTLLATSQMGALLPPDIFPAIPPAADASSPAVIYHDPAGREFTLLTARATAGAPGREPRTLHLAQDISINRTILAGCRRRLLLVFVAGVAFAGGAGLLVARRSLRPLGEIARSARHITASRLDARLDPAAWPHELRECAAAFDAMLDRLQDSFNRLSEFSADLAHAMRNPVNNLRGETEVALTRARTPEEYRQTLGSSLEEFERLSRLIDGLLFLARADDPRTAIEHVRFPVRREMDAVREFYDALASEQGVAVACEGDAELAGDPMLVRRAISNLLGNALKHTPARGRVTLTARPLLAGGGAEIAVTDTGCGIAAGHLPKVFDRFYQVDKTRGPAANGAGLGLAIVRSIMRLHGGAASIQSAAGRGTTVTLTFPRPPAPAAAG